MSKKRIGILTSGGDCPGLNAVIRGVVKASLATRLRVRRLSKGYEGLYDPVQYIPLTPKNTTGILNQGGTILGSTNKGRFAATRRRLRSRGARPRAARGVRDDGRAIGPRAG